MNITQKQRVAEAALDYIPSDTVIGIGTGSTVNYLIQACVKQGVKVKGAVPSSKATEKQLKKGGIPIYALNDVVGDLPLYIDGADQFNDELFLIKGGGGALTREKIIASAAKNFICIVDSSKATKLLGSDFPLAVEVLTMARSFVAHELIKMGGRPVYREGFITDNGHCILDVHDLVITKPYAFERDINQIPGVVAHGLFVTRPADKILIATEHQGVVMKNRFRADS